MNLIKVLLKKRLTQMKPWWSFLLMCQVLLAFSSICSASSVVLQWDPESASNLAGYRVYYAADSPIVPFAGTGATQGHSPLDASMQTSATISGLDPSHAYYFAVTAYNSSGVESSYSNIVTVPELVPPVVSIVSPASGSSVSGTITVSVNASDNIGVTRVEFYVNGVLQGSDTSSPYAFSWNTTSLITGVYTLSALAYDAAGNVGKSGNVSITVINDTTPPTVSLISPANGASVNGTVPISANATDNVAVTKVEFYANGILLMAGNVPPYSYNWSTASIANGSYTLSAKAYDSMGNVGLSSNVIVTVNNLVLYTLAYTADANGTISGSTPQVVNSGGSGAQVTAVANSGYHFVSWSDGVTTAGRTDANVNANTSVTASFAINTYTLAYTAGANGTISGSTPQAVNSGGSGAQVTAVANSGYHFVSWSDGVTTAGRTDANVNANTSVTASFAINTYTLAYTAGANGTISGSTPQTVNSGGSGAQVTAVANSGYHFVSWSDGVTTAGRTDANVNANISVTASFAINTYTLAYTADANGTISGSTPQTVNSGGSGAQVTAVANSSYHFVSWSDGVTTAGRTDAKVIANISVTASFAINTYTLAYTAGANGTISGSTPQTVNSGGSGAQVTAVANSGYHFVSWSDGVTTAGRTDANVIANISVTASFDVTVNNISNIGPLASITASSQNTSTGQTAAKAIDGFTDGYPSGNYTHEWATNGQGIGAWLTLNWSKFYTVGKVVLYDRPNLNDQINSATITFSDGSSITVGTLNNNGAATTYTFPAKVINGLTMKVTKVSGSTQNVGLAEIQVFGY